ncbi:MAG: sulfatase family protein [Planctomycetota bacterium]|jgi:uncharacterized sulfatase
MDRRSFLKKSALAVTSLSLGVKISEAAVVETKRPNILFCISDDQTWLHTSIGGDPVVKTPNFDRVAREGILFTNSFTSCPSCAPCRASILTGQDFWRLEEGGLLFGRLKNKFPIYTRLLEDAGYIVGYTGKGYDPANQRFNYTWKNPCGKPYYKRLNEEPLEGIANIDYAGSFEKFMNARDKTKPFCFWYGGDEAHRDYVYGSGAKAGLDPNKVNVPPFWPDAKPVRNDICDYLLEIQWFDEHLGRMLKRLEENGELENTIIVVTSDNGMPFPRAKATLYNYGVHMPLAIRWGNGIKKPGRVVHDFVNHIDFAPTFLEAAGVKAPEQMTGRSLMKIFKSDKGGWVEPARDMTVVGLERHTWARPDGKTYPRRAIYTQDYAYIRNYEPDRWPMGGPDFEEQNQGTFGDIDAGPTKSYIMERREEKGVKKLFAMSFGKLPAEELYSIDKDPSQMKNLADEPVFREVKERLRKRMEDYQKKTADPRVKGESPWDDYPFYMGKEYLKGKYLEEVQ